MGKAIETICLSRGHEVVLKVSTANAGAAPMGADVAIEFSRPEHALENMKRCLDHGVPVVVGTTGWYDRMPEVQAMVSKSGGALLWASNFSIGVNLLFRVSRQLARLMDPHAAYAVKVDEVHHVHKLDAPSGTALTLARDIDLATLRYSGWVGNEAPAPEDPTATRPVPILSERTGEVPGKHSVSWTSTEDRIVLTHEAFGRQGFATGAVLAAEWLADPRQQRAGLFTMDDVLNTGS